MGIEPDELLTKIQVSSSEEVQRKMEIMKNQFREMGILKLSREENKVIDAETFIKQVTAMQKLGMSKQDMAQIFGISVDLFAKKYELFETEINKYIIPEKLKKRLTHEEFELLEEIKQAIKKANLNKSGKMKYEIPVDDEIAILTAYIKLKEFFLEERNEGLIPDTRGYITKEDFYAILRENNKLLTHSLDNKIRPISELLENYYTRSDANYIFINFPRIFETSYEKLTCNLQIVKDEKCISEMLSVPKNYRCSPTRIYSGIKEWKLNRERALSTSIIKVKDNVELPKRYQYILDSKKKRKQKNREQRDMVI